MKTSVILNPLHHAMYITDRIFLRETIIVPWKLYLQKVFSNFFELFSYRNDLLPTLRHLFPSNIYNKTFISFDDPRCNQLSTFLVTSATNICKSIFFWIATDLINSFPNLFLTIKVNFLIFLFFFFLKFTFFTNIVTITIIQNVPITF